MAISITLINRYLYSAICLNFVISLILPTAGSNIGVGY